jgi:hypothetical protein
MLMLIQTCAPEWEGELWQIALGILLAVALLELAPLIIRGGLLLVGVGLAVVAAFLLFGTDSGRAILLVGGSWFAIGLAFKWAGKQLVRLRGESESAGGFNRWLGDRLLQMRPAFTESQKIAKEADRITRSARSAEIRDRRKSRLEREARAAKERLDRLASANLMHSQRILERRARELAAKFKRYPSFQFVFKDGVLEVSETGAHTNRCVARVRCELDGCYPRFVVTERDARGSIFYGDSEAVKAVQALVRRSAAAALAIRAK